MKKKSSLAICICSSGKRKSIKDCINSIQLQKIEDVLDLSIILIDNSLLGVLKNKFKHHQRYLIHYEHVQSIGIPIARNYALKKALCLNVEWIAFIDDDEIAPEFWIWQMYKDAVVNEADVIEGNVIRVETTEEARRKIKNLAPLTSGIKLTQRFTAATSNVLFKAKYIKSPYDLFFDEKIIMGGSDREFFLRMKQLGARILKSSDHSVVEIWPKDRSAPLYIIKRWSRYGFSFHYRYTKNYSKMKSFFIIFAMVLYQLAYAIFNIFLTPIFILFDIKNIYKLPGKSLARLAYAFGCCAPIFKIYLKNYV